MEKVSGIISTLQSANKRVVNRHRLCYDCATMRYLVLSDIHGNLVALEAVLADVDLESIDQVWCLGDVVGYGPCPNECIDRLRSFPDQLCVAGNHDWAAIGRISIAEFNPSAQVACRWTGEQLSPENADFLANLPTRIVKGQCTLVHGSPREPIWEYIIYPSTAQLNFQFYDTQLCFVGHTHAPAIFREETTKRKFEISIPVPSTPIRIDDERLIINPGSVGQPRDGDPDAAYMVFDPEAGIVEYRRVPYDVSSTQELMMAQGLPESLISRLNFGW
jgi:predicted phosphodiesterase